MGPCPVSHAKQRAIRNPVIRTCRLCSEYGVGVAVYGRRGRLPLRIGVAGLPTHRLTIDTSRDQNTLLVETACRSSILGPFCNGLHGQGRIGSRSRRKRRYGMGCSHGGLCYQRNTDDARTIGGDRFSGIDPGSVSLRPRSHPQGRFETNRPRLLVELSIWRGVPGFN